MQSVPSRIPTVVTHLFFTDAATTEIYTYGHTLSQHDALPIYAGNPARQESRSRRRLNRARHDQQAHLQAASPGRREGDPHGDHLRSEEHTSELQSLMRTSYAVFCLQQKKTNSNSGDTTNPEVPPSTHHPQCIIHKTREL